MNRFITLGTVIGLVFLAGIGWILSAPVPFLSAQELVRKHEATWSQLRHLRIDIDDHYSFCHGSKESRMRQGASGEFTDEFGLQTALVVHAGESRERREIYLDGERCAQITNQSEFRRIDEEIVEGKTFRTAEYAIQRDRPSRCFYDGELSYAIGDSEVTIRRRPETVASGGGIYFGEGISIGLFPATKSLRQWVAESRPTVRRIKNSAGETCYQLKGKMRSQVLSGTFNLFRDDELTVTVNADRGCLIEQLAFQCPDLQSDYALSTRKMAWRVANWLALSNGGSFPAAANCAFEYREIERTSWRRWKVREIELNPPIHTDLFDRTIPEGSVVYDKTKRPGHPAVAIWGVGNKPVKTFATLKEYFANLEQVEAQNHFENWAYTVANLFPGCVVKAAEGNGASFPLLVCDQNGEVIREIRSVAEIHTLEMLRGLLSTSPQMLARDLVVAFGPRILPRSVVTYLLGDESDLERAYFDKNELPVMIQELEEQR